MPQCAGKSHARNRLGAGGARVADVLKERGLARGRIGLVGFGPTAPGEAEGLLPLGFHTTSAPSMVASVLPISSE